MSIRFGTDGWRAVISEEYTFSNVRLVAAAVGKWLAERGEKEKGVIVGYDARFLSRRYGELVAETLTGMDIPVWLSDSMLPTPALSWQVVDRTAALGIMITASHNPPEYNGIKLKAAYGGAATPALVAEVEGHVRLLEVAGWAEEASGVGKKAAYDSYSPRQAYLNHIKAVLQKDVLQTFAGKAILDVMHGAAQGYGRELAREYDLDLEEIHSSVDPAFGGINPEPVEKNLQQLRERVLESKAVVGLATDGDGDRIAAVDADGRVLSSFEIIALLTQFLAEKRGWSGGVAQTLSISHLVRGVAEKHGLPLYELPVGFKHVTALMLEKDILIGGEEAGGIGIKNYIPERDGLLLAFLLLEMIAAYGKNLGEILADMTRQTGRFFYRREDLLLPQAQKEKLLTALAEDPPASLGPVLVEDIVRGDGCKLILPGGWLIFRASGTEPIVRIYSESDDEKQLQVQVEKAVEYAKKIRN